MTPHCSTIRVPELVRLKPGALDRVGIYLSRAGCRKVAWLRSTGLPEVLVERVRTALQSQGISLELEREIVGGSFEEASALLAELTPDCQAMVGLGGGKVLDTAKHVATLANRPYLSVPTSLSNDGFCSPQASLTLHGRRRSLASRLPWGVVVDTEVCRHAPHALWASGVGDLVAKLTATADWKLSCHATGEPVNDLAVLLSEATVHQFAGRPACDAEATRLLGTALMLNGIAMELAGSSRPASGSEHLLSHALDELSARPRLHGLQVGVATYLAAHLQGGAHVETIGRILDGTGFWDVVAADPFHVAEWREAFARAPGIKPGFHTVLSTRDCWPEAQRLIAADPRLRALFQD